MSLEPQQRVVLENVYVALENSGFTLEQIAGSNTSVYVSGFNHDHLAILNSDPETTLRHRVTGLTNFMHSKRVSWFFDLKGPSVTIDTACSSSMAALHLGSQSLRTGESNMAIITGVTITNYPGKSQVVITSVSRPLTLMFPSRRPEHNVTSRLPQSQWSVF